MNEETQVVETESATQQEGSKTYSEQEVQALLQSEVDRRITTAQKKWEAKTQAQMAEAEKLRKMDEAQRTQYEYDKRIADLEAKEREFALRENKIEAQRILIDKGLPKDMVEYVVADDAETMMERITSFERMFNAAVNDAVAKRVATPAPRSSNSVSQTGMTKEKFSALSLQEQAELFHTNPNLYRELVRK